MSKPEFRLCVGIPTTGLWQSEFGLHLLSLMSKLLTVPVPGYRGQSAIVVAKQSSLLPKSRRQLLEDAIEADCTHVLFIDTDQVFHPLTAHKLASWKKPIVACNVPVKKLPSNPTARNFNPAWPGGDVVHTRMGSSGLEKVWRVGCGIMLVDLRVLASVPKPWFSIVYDDTMKDETGEDWFFCEQLEKAGIPRYVDHDASKYVGHIGGYTYTFDDVSEEVLLHEVQEREERQRQEVLKTGTGG